MKQKRALLPSSVAPLEIPVDEELANSSPARAPVQAPKVCCPAVTAAFAFLVVVESRKVLDYVALQVSSRYNTLKSVTVRY